MTMKTSTENIVIKLTREDVEKIVKPTITAKGYTIEEWLKGCANWTILDLELRNLWIQYKRAFPQP